MDTIIQATTVIAAFAAVHERVLELLRNWLVKGWKWLSEDQFDRRNILFAVALALVTHANLLDLFFTVKTEEKNTLLFFERYMAWGKVWIAWTTAPNVLGLVGNILHDVLGCVLMGLATALGSKFWHDVVKGIIDFRDTARALGKLGESRPQATPQSTPRAPAAPPSTFISGTANPSDSPRVPPPAPPMQSFITM